MYKRLINRQTITFGLVGIANTLVDFVIFIALNKAGLYVIVANFISTSVALSFSFLMNRKYTFSKRKTKRENQFQKFIIITALGLWVLQPILIQIFLFGERLSGVTELLREASDFVELDIVVAKAIAIVGSMAWNYLWYSRYVFRHHEEEDEQ